MTNGSDSRSIVYYYADPAFAWDVGSALADLERRGFRIVTGDNADELLFLLQMGRPAAIIYTVAQSAALAHGSFLLVSSRAIDMLVPVFVIGPDDPRDGVLLRYPVGGVAEESHAPFHALGDLIERFDAEPPSTPSRPPMTVANQTFGKGRTMMSWRRDGPIVTPANYGAESHEPLNEQKTSAPAAPPANDHKERKTLPAKNAHASEDESVRGAVPSATPTISAISPPPSAPAASMVAARAEGPVRAVRVDPEPERRSPNRASRPVAWKLPAALAAGVAIGVAALVVYLATAPGRVTEATRPTPATAPREPAGVPLPTAAGIPVAQDGATAGKPPVETPPAVIDGAPGGTTAPRPRAPGEPKDEEALLTDASGTVRFPGHFRETSAMFWFAGDWEERRFLNLVRSLGPNAKIRVIGHSTAEELAAGLHNLALSRAWAVEKYLVRQGIADERIETEKGALVTSGADLDERGWPRNRWVDVRFD